MLGVAGRYWLDSRVQPAPILRTRLGAPPIFADSTQEGAWCIDEQPGSRQSHGRLSAALEALRACTGSIQCGTVSGTGAGVVKGTTSQYINLNGSCPQSWRT